jgi:O-acetylserine/cysteine efflux transporter
MNDGNAQISVSRPAATGLSARDIAMGLAVALIWGLGYVVAKGAIAHFPPILLMAFRFTVTALALVWFAGPLRGNFRRLLALSIIGVALQYSLTFTGLKGLDASIAVLITQLEVPFLVLLGALLLREQPSARKWLGIATAFLGVALIAGQVRFTGEWTAVLMLAGGAFAWALAQILVRGIRGMGGLAVTAWVAVLATPQLFLISALFEDGQLEAILGAGINVWAAAFYLGLVVTAIGYWLWNSLILRHEVGRAAPFLLLMPLFTVAGGILILGEDPAPGRLLGGLVVLAGVAVIIFDRRRQA